MKIKHWDEASQQWVIDGASNASNIELTNPSFTDSEGHSVSVDHGFTKVSNKLNKLEKNLAWLYLNGAKGGGSGGPGGSENYTISVSEGSTIYTASSSVTINVTITSGTLKKPFTLVAKNINTNVTLGTWKLYSLTRTQIQLTNLSGNSEIELSAYDSSNNYTSPVYLNVVSGAISLSIQNIPNKTMYIGGVASFNTNFTINNNVVGSSAEFELKCNNIIVASETGINTTFRTLSYDLRNIIFNNVNFSPVVGSRYYFSAVASTSLNSSIISSNVITFDITVADANNLVIVVDGITENVTEDLDNLTKYTENSQLGFSYYLSYAPTIHSTFNIDYKVYIVYNNEETEIDSGRIVNIAKGVDNRFVYSTVNIRKLLPDEYLKITLSASSVNNPLDTSAQYTKSVYCILKEAISVDLHANNDQQTLLAYFSKISGFPNSSFGSWIYNLPTTGKFTYNGAFKNSFNSGVKLTLKDANGVNSGFISDTDKVNSIPGVVLKGGAYGYLEVGEKMFPDVEITSGESFFQHGGFNISLTFKADFSSDPDEVIMSLGKYKDGVLDSGIEITLEQVYVKIGSADTIICKLPQNELLTVDIDVSYLHGGWYFKVFLNGVMSAVTRVMTSDINWQFGTDLYLGCRYEGQKITGARDTGNKSRFSNITVYDLKLYTSSQTDLAIVQNYMSAVEQARLIKGEIDSNLDAELRTKNMFDSSGNCIIWDKNARGGLGGYLEGNALYQAFYDQIGKGTPYPIVLIEETSSAETLLEAYSTAIFSASNKDTIMSAQFPVKVTYIDDKGREDIITPSGVNSSNGVRLSLQGTSSLSYNSKNFELYIGDKDESGKKLLFRPDEGWLPENRFTLKADVMDSAHVNNVVIGKIINGTSVTSTGTPFANTPPMSLSSSEVPNEIRSKIKHTSEGFPCLLFIRYSSNTTQKQIKFLGIYNFNLGRHAHYNLGMKLLTQFTPEKLSGPTLVKEYEENVTKWNSGSGEGMYSLEINQNNSAQGAFQQDALPIIKFMSDVVFSSQDESSAYTKAQSFYSQMANMTLSRTPKYTMDDAGQTPTKPISHLQASSWVEGSTYNLNSIVYDSKLIYYKSLVENNSSILPTSSNEHWEVLGEQGAYYNLDKNAYYNFSACDNFLNWQNACAYFVTAIVFGMVDSMCKNLTLRNWGSNTWFTCFYDMDTAFGLNNAGQDIVDYTAHLHRWYNIRTQDTGLSTFTQHKNYVSVDNVKQYYASWWNRIWEVLENLAIIDSGGVGSRTSIEQTYADLRTNLFPDPDDFIDKNYKSYTDKTGSLIFNYDYNIKYLKIAQTYDINTGTYSDSTDFSQLKFLHGVRVMHVRDWFKKRIHFLDGVYGVNANTVNLPSNIESPVTKLWAANKSTGSPSNTKFGITLSSNSTVLYRYSYDNTWGSFWISEKPETFVVPMPSGETIISIYANNYIKQFTNFKGYPWTGLNNINLPLLEELDLSGLTNIPASDFFFGGVHTGSGIGLKNIKKLILKNVVLSGSGASAYTLDVSRCSKLEHLDISNSSITNVSLPSSAVLKTYDLSGTKITSLNLSNQSFLENLNLDNCEELKTITIENCGKLKSLNIPKNISTLIIKNCPLLSSINITYSSINNSISPLNRISVDNCPGLKSFNISGQNNPHLIVELAGAWNLENVNVSNTLINRSNLIYPSSEIWKTLKNINMSKTYLSGIKFTDVEFDYLDFTGFDELNSIIITDCENITKVSCKNNPAKPVNLYSHSFSGCLNLKRVTGNYNISGINVFKNCRQLIINDPRTYSNQGVSNFLTDFMIGEELIQATNIKFDNLSSNLFGTFESCVSLTYDDFKLLMPKIGDNITSMEAMFKGCFNINGAIWYDMFRNCKNVTILKETFSGTNLSGVFYSRDLNFNENDTSTYGILDFLPKLTDCESAFEGTNLTWIDNRLFSPIMKNGEYIYSPIIKVDRMFRNCLSLKICENTRDLNITKGYLRSENFFINLRNLINVYPKEVFEGCKNVDMIVDHDALGNTLLFHKIENISAPIVLTNSLYTGVNLIGEINENVFGGINRQLLNYYIPIFSSIQYPFNTGSRKNELTVNLSQMGKIFRRLGDNLLQAIGVFVGTTCRENDSIPPDIFKGCIKLNSIEGCFSKLKVNNNGQPYIFPATYVDEETSVTKGMFEDCVSLKNTSFLFSNCHYLKIKLQGEGFKNTKLTNVNNMFENSALFGTIPYRLFFMTVNKPDGTFSYNQSITDMRNIFSGCWCLGYDENREVDLDRIAYSLPNNKTEWHHRIIKSEGNKVNFKLDVSKMKKEYDPDSNSVCFDSWYLDGYGWENVTAENQEEQEELNNLKASLYNDYLSYDESQKNAILQHNETDRYVDSNQNYMIPTDLFRYCDKDCTLSGVLNHLSWVKQEIVINPETGESSVHSVKDASGNFIYEGLTGRIPTRLFESLKTSTRFIEVFRNTRFDAFVGLQSQSFTRGIMYPPDLFKHNVMLTDINGVFSGTSLPVGVDVNLDIFKNLSELRVVSNLWSNCNFDNRPYSAEAFTEEQLIHSQINFANVFNYNTKITNASGLFAAYSSDKGLKLIDSSLFNRSFNMNSISNMFYYNTLMKGTVPEFNSAVYPVLNNVSGYLLGCIKHQIQNANNLELRLIPSYWL